MSIRQESEPVREGVVPVPEIVFRDNAAWLLANDYKLLTVRWPDRKYDFAPGTVVKALCKYEGEDGTPQEDAVELVVVANETRPLCDFSPLVLMCDGFTSPGDGADKLSRFYQGHGGVASDTRMQAIFTMSKKQFDFLREAERKNLLERGFSALDGTDQPLQALTWRAACFWFLDQFYTTYDDDDCWPAWVRYVLSHNQFGQGWGDDPGDVDALVKEVTEGEDPISVDDLLLILEDPIVFAAEFNKYVLLVP